jgi:ERF superfamily
MPVPENIPSIHAALTAVKRDVNPVGKKERNTQQGFNYRGIDSVVNAVSPALAQHGVITVPQVLGDLTYETVEIGSKRTPMAHVVAMVKYSFYGPAGDHVDAVVFSEAMDSGDKAVAKMMSVAYRIALLQVLSLPTDEADPDSQSYERASQPAKPDLQELVTQAANLTTLDELRKFWEKTGALGMLTKEIVLPSSGEKIQFQEYLTQRSAELASKSGSPAGGNGAGESTRTRRGAQ